SDRALLSLHCLCRCCVWICLSDVSSVAFCDQRFWWFSVWICCVLSCHCHCLSRRIVNLFLHFQRRHLRCLVLAVHQSAAFLFLLMSLLTVNQNKIFWSCCLL